uniref:Uncharacterized protein n=1 Tax=Strongyloides stercoralis TaxID=6248 RepID=A0A0K0DZY1_STRER
MNYRIQHTNILMQKFLKSYFKKDPSNKGEKSLSSVVMYSSSLSKYSKCVILKGHLLNLYKLYEIITSIFWIII